MAATIEAVCSRVMKERQKKIDKGITESDLNKEFGSEEAHQKKECMKEVWTIMLVFSSPTFCSLFPNIIAHIFRDHP